MINRSQIRRDFTTEQIAKLVCSLGSDDCREDSTAPDHPLIFQTICHNPAHTGSYKLYYYPDSKQFHCYTECSCNFDVYELVMRSRKCSFFEALQYVQDTLGLQGEERTGFFEREEEPEPPVDWEMYERYAKYIEDQPEIETIEPISESILDYYPKAYPVEWTGEHISHQAMDRFGIRFSPVDNEIIIPHRNMDGELIGIRSRTLNKEKVALGNKYMPTVLEGRDFRHPLRQNLYGLDVCKDCISRIHKIMLCEGEKSALQSYSYYGENSFTVAVCGSNVSSIQRDLILKLGVNEVFIAFDKEYHVAYSDESKAYVDKLLRIAAIFVPYVTTYIVADTDHLLEYKDSPTDRGKEILETLLKRKWEVETAS